MSAWKIARRIALTACLAIAGPLAAHAQDNTDAAPKARVVIVLDASGSMWGQVDGKAKIAIARGVIHDMMKNWDKSIDVGLIAYGHRRKGDCQDIETLVPVGPADPKAIDKAVDDLNPKGKTPLTAAVKRAAEDLKYTEEAATVILISDGLETCHADPCAAATAMAKAGVNFKADVIGFGLKKSEQKKLRCLADNTGGMFLAAKDASTLEASLGKAVESAKKEAKPKPPAVKNIHFSATYAKDGPPVKSGANWTVYTAKADMQGKHKKVAHSYDTKPVFKLDPGDYTVKLHVGDTTVEKDFTVEAGKGQKITVVLNAGLLALEAKRTEDADKPAKGLGWKVYTTKTDINGKHKNVAGSYSDSPVITLPAGEYRVVVTKGDARAEGTATVTAGERAEKTLYLKSGILAAKAVLAKGGTPVDGLGWKIVEVKTNIEGKHKHVAGSYSAKPSWELPAGDYLLRVKQGEARAEKPVTVSANQRTDATLVLNAGVLAVKAEGAKPDRWNLTAGKPGIDGKRKHIGGSYGATPSWTLPAGTYHIAVKAGDKSAERDVTIKAGQRNEVTLTPQ